MLIHYAVLFMLVPNLFVYVWEISSKGKVERFLKSLKEQICAQYIGFKTKIDIH